MWKMVSESLGVPQAMFQVMSTNGIAIAHANSNSCALAKQNIFFARVKSMYFFRCPLAVHRLGESPTRILIEDMDWLQGVTRVWRAKC